jgi:CMP-N-acetylneuraminic acid synthetase
MTNREPRIICLIPARKGSEGLVRKNLRIVGCNTLVSRTIKVAKKINWPVHIILSSDDETVQRRYSKKVDTFIKRKCELSRSNSLIADVIQDALASLTDVHDSDYFLLLEPSSPNMNIVDINIAIQTMIDNNYSSLVTVSPVDEKYHPYKVLKVKENSTLTAFMDNSPKIFNRQEIASNAYYKNGVAYLYKIGVVKNLEPTKFNLQNYLVTDHRVSNIDTDIDLWVARYLLFRGFLSHLNSLIRESFRFPS